MRNLLALLLILSLSACATDAPAEAGTNVQNSAPAPGIMPAPTITGDGSITPGSLAGFPSGTIVDCDCSLRLDPTPAGMGADDLFFVFNWKDGPGIIGINGEEVTVQRGASLKAGGQKHDSYLHENNNYSVQTSLTRESAAGDEGGEYAGSVKIKNKASGKIMRAKVVGTCSC